MKTDVAISLEVSVYNLLRQAGDFGILTVEPKPNIKGTTPVQHNGRDFYDAQMVFKEVADGKKYLVVRECLATPEGDSYANGHRKVVEFLGRSGGRVAADLGSTHIYIEPREPADAEKVLIAFAKRGLDVKGTKTRIGSKKYIFDGTKLVDN